MNREENNLLVNWLDGHASADEIDKLSEVYDLPVLQQNINNLAKVAFQANAISKSWESFTQKRESNHLKGELVTA